MNEYRDRLLAKVAEIKAQQQAKDIDLADLRGKVEGIRALVDDFGSGIPTLAKLTTLIKQIQEII